MKTYSSAVVSMAIISAFKTIQGATDLGINITADADCVVAIDDKFVSRVYKDHAELVRCPSGRHTLSAATREGDYFEQSVEVLSEPGPSITISFEKANHEKLAMERKVADLHQKVIQGQKELARRRSIVAAVNYYADRWGKQLGITDGLNQAAKNLDDIITDQGIQNVSNTSTAVQAVTEAAMGIEWLRSRHLKNKAHLNGFVAAVASRHLEYLRSALNDPLKYGPDREDLGYLATVHDVRRSRSRTTGKLLTAPDRIEYSDTAEEVRIPCASVLGARGEGELHIAYKDATQKRNNLIVRADQRLDRQMLLGDIYLACPNQLQ